MNRDQCRMARAAVQWSQSDLAEASGIRQATVSSFEAGGDCRQSTVEKMRNALEAKGVTFLADGLADMSGKVGVAVKS